MVRNLIVLSLITVSLTGCDSSNTVFRSLPNSAGLVSYECVALDEEAASAAADEAHAIYVRDFYSSMVAQQEKINLLKAAGESTQDEIRAVNAETISIQNAAEEATQNTGCVFDGAYTL